MLACVPATERHSCYSQLTSSMNKPMLSTTPMLQRTHFQLIQASFLHAHQLVSTFSANAKLQRIHLQANWYGPPCYKYIILFPHLVPLPNYKEYTSKSIEMGPFVKCTCTSASSHVKYHSQVTNNTPPSQLMPSSQVYRWLGVKHQVTYSGVQVYGTNMAGLILSDLVVFTRTEEGMLWWRSICYKSNKIYYK